MKILEIKPDGFPCKLKECPSGFFIFNDELCFKSDYLDYFCSNGDCFWGGTNNVVHRGNLIVQPCVAVWSEK